MNKITIKYLTLTISLLTLGLSICIASEQDKAQDKTTPFQAVQVDVSKNVPPHILSAKLGDPEAIYNLAHSYQHGTNTEIDLDKAKIWYQKAANTKSPAVRYKIGRMYETGGIFEKDIDLAVSHYIFAAEAEDVNAQANLGAIYLSQKDKLEDGIRWSKKAAQSNSVQAQINLAITYQRGLTGEVNKERAVYWYKAAADNNNAFAQHQLGLYYYYIKDYKEAFYWFDLATQLNNQEAMLFLSMMFDNGLGTDQNREKSISILEKAAELGNEKAIGILKQLKN